MVLDPGAAVVVHPNLNSLFPAYVVTGFLGLNPFEFHNFLALGEEEFPDGSVGFGIGWRGDGLGGGGICQIAHEFIKGRDGKFEEPSEFNGVIRRHRGLILGRRWQLVEHGNGEIAALGNIMLGQPDEVATATDAQAAGATVNLRQNGFRQRNTDGSLVF